MTLHTEVRDGALLVRPAAARLDAAAAPAFKEAFGAAVAGGPGRIVLDMGQVGFMDSSGLGTLVGCLKLLGMQGELILADVQPSVKRLLQLTKLERVFTIAPSVDEALAGPPASA